MLVIDAVKAIFLMKRDWWELYSKINMGGGNSYRLAYSVRQLIQNSGIALNSKFLGRPVFPHGIHGIFVSGEAEIGKDCVIFQQVTIGSNRLIDSRGFGAPKIGNNCYIGAGAKIIGNVVIGDNCRIGANTVVTKDVPDNSTVVSGEMRIIPHQGILDTRYCTINQNGQWVAYENGKFEPL